MAADGAVAVCLWGRGSGSCGGCVSPCSFMEMLLRSTRLRRPGPFGREGEAGREVSRKSTSTDLGELCVADAL